MSRVGAEGEVLDWPAWAVSVKGLSRTQQHVLRVLCEACDERGTLVMSAREMAARVLVHRATLFRALAVLEERGVVRRERQWDQWGASSPTRFQLLRHAPRVDTELVSRGAALMPLVVRVVEWGDHAGLSALIAHLETCDWRDEAACEVLAASLQKVQARWAAMVVSRVKGVLDPSLVGDEVVGVAWMCCRSEASSLVGARRAWHLLTVMVIRSFTTQACTQVDMRSTHSSFSVEELSECTDMDSIRPVSGEAVVIGVDEVEDSGVLSRVRDALVAAGMPATVAGVALARAATLAASFDETRVDAIAKNDASLARLGLGGSVGADMVALVRGRRRHPEEACVYLSDSELAVRCEAIIRNAGMRKVS